MFNIVPLGGKKFHLVELLVSLGETLVSWFETYGDYFLFQKLNPA